MIYFQFCLSKLFLLLPNVPERSNVLKNHVCRVSKPICILLLTFPLVNVEFEKNEKIMKSYFFNFDLITYSFDSQRPREISYAKNHTCRMFKHTFNSLMVKFEF